LCLAAKSTQATPFDLLRARAQTRKKTWQRLLPETHVAIPNNKQKIKNGTFANTSKTEHLYFTFENKLIKELSVVGSLQA